MMNHRLLRMRNAECGLRNFSNLHSAIRIPRSAFELPILILVFLLALSIGADAGPPTPTKTFTFEGDVVAFLKKHCIECHGGKKPKGELALDIYQKVESVDENPEIWEKVREMLESEMMPPEDRPRPNRSKVQRIVRWIEAKLSSIALAEGKDPGRVTLRRLNRSEYNNTIRDLVGIDFRPADDFPIDDSGYGFDNIGDVLSLSPTLMEKYMAAAEKIVRRAISDPDSHRAPIKKFEADRLKGGEGRRKVGVRVRTTKGGIYTYYRFPEDGKYILRATVFGQQAGPEPVRMAFGLGGRKVKVFEVEEDAAAPATYETPVDVKAGSQRYAVLFLNDYFRPKDPDPKNRDRNLVVISMEVQGPIDLGSEELPESHKRIMLSQATGEGDEHERARKIIANFARRAFRRPVTDQEVYRLLRYVQLAREEGDSFERGIQLALQAILVSPHFLFRVELNRPQDGGEGTAQLLGDFELASRLSYFLWSSMPDETLFALAERGKLQEPKILRSQVRRMLKDSKSKALTEHFAGQWLQTRKLGTISPDPELFPEFDEELRASMRTETEMFFEFLLRENRSVLEFLDAEYTFLNERLARHYGIEGVQGDHFRRMTIADGRRGGLITHASFLTITSNPTRTSPVSRGKWISEELLGTPLPPPPQVESLREDDEAASSLTLRQQMEQHRRNSICASCHSRMDPLGFGLENYDAIGGWRDRDRKIPIDASGQLPGGESFVGPAELKKVLLEKKDEFIHCLAEKMLTYALGRGLVYHDEAAIKRILEALESNHYRFRALILETVKSDPFRMR